MKPIYLKFEKYEKKPKTIYDLLKKLFSNGSVVITNIKTYSNEKCSHLQCDKGKYRSFDDIVRIVNTYFPNTSVKDVFGHLLKLKVLNYYGNNCKLQMDFCNTMNKIKLYYSSAKYKENTFNSIKSLPRYNSKYSWNDLFEMLDIKTVEDLIKFSEEKY